MIKYCVGTAATAAHEATLGVRTLTKHILAPAIGDAASVVVEVLVLFWKAQRVDVQVQVKRRLQVE